LDRSGNLSPSPIPDSTVSMHPSVGVEESDEAQHPVRFKKTRMKNEPNNAVEPTPVDVTIPAAQEVAPSTSAAHLGR
jgi:hypothetical protein